MMTFDGELVDELTRRQRALGISDHAFGLRLGMTGNGWWQIRTHRRRIGVRAARGIVAAYPDLADSVRAYLLPH